MRTRSTSPFRTTRSTLVLHGSVSRPSTSMPGQESRNTAATLAPCITVSPRSRQIRGPGLMRWSQRSKTPCASRRQPRTFRRGSDGVTISSRSWSTSRGRSLFRLADRPAPREALACANQNDPGERSSEKRICQLDPSLFTSSPRAMMRNAAEHRRRRVTHLRSLMHLNDRF